MSLEQRQTLHCLLRLFDCCRCRAAVRAAGVTAAAFCAVTACVRAWPFVVAAVASLTVLPLLLLMLPVCWVVQDPANEPVWPALYCTAGCLPVAAVAGLTVMLLQLLRPLCMLLLPLLVVLLLDLLLLLLLHH